MRIRLFRAFFCRCPTGTACFHWPAISASGDSPNGRCRPTTGTFFMTGPATAAAILSAIQPKQAPRGLHRARRPSARSTARRAVVSHGRRQDGSMRISRFTAWPYWYGVLFRRRKLQEFPSWKVDMISGAQLLEVDLRSGSVTTLMESPDLSCRGNLGNGFGIEGRRGRSRPVVHRHASVRPCPDNGPGPRLRRTGEATHRVPASRGASATEESPCTKLARDSLARDSHSPASRPRPPV